MRISFTSFRVSKIVPMLIILAVDTCLCDVNKKFQNQPHICISKPIYQFNSSFNISSVWTTGEAMRGGGGGAWKGGSHEGDEAELNLDIKHRGRDVKAVARGPEMSGRSSVPTPFPALPWESHACCNNVATDFIPLPPRLFTLNLLSSRKKLTTWLYWTCSKGFRRSWKFWKDGGINHFCVRGHLKRIYKD